MFNLYNVFHQLNNLSCDKIFIYNFSIISNCYSKTLWDKINKDSENKIEGFKYLSSTIPFLLFPITFSYYQLKYRHCLA